MTDRFALGGFGAFTAAAYDALNRADTVAYAGGLSDTIKADLQAAKQALHKISVTLEREHP